MKYVIKVIDQDLFLYKERNIVKLVPLVKTTLYNTTGSASVALKSDNCKIWLQIDYHMQIEQLEIRPVTLILQ